MDFREAIDDLCERVGHDDVAAALGVSVQTIRQARMQEATKAKRTPPSGWQEAVLKMAEDRLAHYAQLISDLQSRESNTERFV